MKKVCTKCNKSLSLGSFYKHKLTSDKLTHDCKECIKKRSRDYRKENKHKRAEQDKKYYHNNKEKIKKYQKKYQKENKEHLLEYKKEWYEKNRERVIERVGKNHRKRLKEDINYKLAYYLRCRLRSSIKKNAKSGSFVRDLGCSIDELKAHLECQFKPGMTWDNYGKWHIDHIMPLASFNLSNREQFLKACHYTNLQPLWAEENLSKGAKLNHGK